MANKPVLGLAGLFLAAGVMVGGCQNSPSRTPGMQGSRQPVVAGGNPNRGGSAQPQVVQNPPMMGSTLTPAAPQPIGTGSPQGATTANSMNSRPLNQPLNMTPIHNVSGQPGTMNNAPVVPASPAPASPGAFPGTPVRDPHPMPSMSPTDGFGQPAPPAPRPVTSHHTAPPALPSSGAGLPPLQAPPLTPPMN